MGRKPIKSRKKVLKPIGQITTPTGLLLTEAWCRRCMKMLPAKRFHTSYNHELDKNGLLSVCKPCVDDLFDRIFSVENNLDRAILNLCRKLDICFSELAVEATRKHVATSAAKSVDIKNPFGIYKAKLASYARGFSGGDMTDLTFVEPSREVIERTIINEIPDIEAMRIFWGSGLQDEDYDFLEKEMARYKRTHKCDTATEESLLRQICFAELDIRSARAGGQPSASAVKLLQDLMKTASVDPAKTAIAGAGKSHDTFSAFIKTIEENEPAEYYEDKKLFADYDNIDYYFKKYILLPIKNFVIGSRDFALDGTDPDSDIELELEEDFPDLDLDSGLVQ